MILNSLVRLAHNEQLLGMPGYVKMPIQWRVILGRDGSIKRIEHLQQKRQEQRGKRTKTIKFYPEELLPQRRSRGGTAVVADLLVDKAQYTMGLGKPGDTKRARLSTCLGDFISVTAQIAADTKDDGVEAMLKALRAIQTDPKATLAKSGWTDGEGKPTPQGDAFVLQPPKEWKTNHLIGFWYDDDYVWRRPAVIRWVAKYFAPEQPTDEAGDLCLVTGKWSVPARVHNQIDLAGDTGRLPLISFNQTAFEHHGRKKNENAPVSEEVATAYFIALRRLLDRDPARASDGQKLDRRNLLLTLDTTVVYWADWGPEESDPILENDPIAALTVQERNMQITRLYSAPWQGSPPGFHDHHTLHVLILTRVKSRVILRAPILSTLGEVARSVGTYFDETDICPRGPNERDHRAVRWLSEATISKEVSSMTVPPEMAAQLFLCAIDDRRPYPKELLAAVLRRVRANDGEGISTRRAGLIKAVLNRYSRLNPTSSQEFTVSLQEDRPDPPYQLGRLLAVLEQIQAEAINDVNATILDRHLGAVMATPALVYPKLLKLSHHHISKLQKKKPGFAVKLGKLLDSIISHLDSFPPRLEMSEQGSLLIGYHHQRAERFRSSKNDQSSKEDEQ